MLKWLGFRESFANFLVLFFVLALIFSVILPLYLILHLPTHLLIKLFLILFFIRTSRLGLETSTSIIVRALTSRRHLISSFRHAISIKTAPRYFAFHYILIRPARSRGRHSGTLTLFPKLSPVTFKVAFRKSTASVRLIAIKRFPEALAHFRLHIRSRPTLAQIV